MLGPMETQNCESGNADCLKDLQDKKENCVPSSTIIEGRDGILLMVNITREGDKCIRTETVIGADPESDYLLDHNVTCESGLSDLDDPRSQVCPGSLYDYVVPSGDGGAPGAVPPPGIPELGCGLDDDECKTEADEYLHNCINAKITNTELRWDPDGFWTLFFNISRETEECYYYIEVLNAVNLPPGVPTTIIGMNMTCNIPFSEFPVGNLTATWCTGELYDYLYD
jgi:hypothetical protein